MFKSLSEKINGILNELNEWISGNYNQLSPEGKQIAVIASIMGSLLLTGSFLYFSQSYISNQMDMLSNKDKLLKNIRQFSNEYKYNKQKIDDLERQLSLDFKLSSFIERQVVRHAGSKEFIDKDNPLTSLSSKTDLFEDEKRHIELKNIPLSKVLNILYQLETHKNPKLTITLLHMKPTFDDPNFLDVKFDIGYKKIKSTSKETKENS